MNFSYEEIYAMYGQYDTYVYVHFHFDSESYSKYGYEIGGTFYYQLQEREDLQKKLVEVIKERTDQRVLFKANFPETLTPSQITELDRDGFNVSDINSVLSFNLPRENRFATHGVKTIPNTTTIKVNAKNLRLDHFDFKMNKLRLSTGDKLSPEEYNKHYGYYLYYLPEQVTPEMREQIQKTENTRDSVRFHYLSFKYDDGLTKEEEKEWNDLIGKRTRINLEILKSELQRNVNSNVKQALKNHVKVVIALATSDRFSKVCHFF